MESGSVVYRSAKDAATEKVMPLKGIPLKGAHNVENVLAAVVAARLAGVSADVIRRAIEKFQAVEHRLEYVATIQRRRVLQRLQGHQRGRHRQGYRRLQRRHSSHPGRQGQELRLHPLADLLRERVSAVYTIGAAAAKIESHLRGVVSIHSCETLDKAVNAAAAAARPGEVVLLAPACSSFDQFENYEQRGQVFKQLVKELRD